MTGWRTRGLAFAAAWAVTWAAAPGAHAAPKVGEPAPDFSVTTFGGHQVKLADLKGDVIIQNFWATWCTPCRKELPLLEAYFEANSQYGFQVLAIATEGSVPESKLKPLAAALRIPLVKHLSGPYHDLGAIPTNYIINRSGKLVYAKAAAFDIDDLNTIVLPLLKEPIPPSSAPLGAAQAPTQAAR